MTYAAQLLSRHLRCLVHKFEQLTVPWHNDGTTAMKPGAVQQQMNSRMRLEVVDFIDPDPLWTFVTNIWG